MIGIVRSLLLFLSGDLSSSDVHSSTSTQLVVEVDQRTRLHRVEFQQFLQPMCKIKDQRGPVERKRFLTGNFSLFRRVLSVESVHRSSNHQRPGSALWTVAHKTRQISSMCHGEFPLRSDRVDWRIASLQLLLMFSIFRRLSATTDKEWSIAVNNSTDQVTNEHRIRLGCCSRSRRAKRRRCFFDASQQRRISSHWVSLRSNWRSDACHWPCRQSTEWERATHRRMSAQRESSPELTDRRRTLTNLQYGRRTFFTGRDGWSWWRMESIRWRSWFRATVIDFFTVTSKETSYWWMLSVDRWRQNCSALATVTRHFSFWTIPSKPNPIRHSPIVWLNSDRSPPASQLDASQSLSHFTLETIRSGKEMGYLSQLFETIID